MIATKMQKKNLGYVSDQWQLADVDKLVGDFSLMKVNYHFDFISRFDSGFFDKLGWDYYSQWITRFDDSI